MHGQDTRTHISERSAAAIIFIIRNEVQTEEPAPSPPLRAAIEKNVHPFLLQPTTLLPACSLFYCCPISNMKVSLGAVFVLRMIHSVGNRIYCDGHSIMWLPCDGVRAMVVVLWNRCHRIGFVDFVQTQKWINGALLFIVHVFGCHRNRHKFDGRTIFAAITFCDIIFLITEIVWAPHRHTFDYSTISFATDRVLMNELTRIR